MELFKLIPHGSDIFNLLKEQADITGRAGSLLLSLFQNPDRSRDLCSEINELCRKGESKISEVLKKINILFVTPLDREDLFNLTFGMEENLKMIKGIAGRFGLFEITQPTSTSVDLAELLAEMTSRIKTWIENIENRISYERKIEGIEDLAEKSELLLKLGLTELFEKASDGDYNTILSVIQWSQIYDRMERAIDCCKQIARVIDGILLKNQ
ncbi:MAG: DUF47 family protein [Candidatus Eremiobacteraeota bacterium]|nr:DUF47 family protein [Candidatus Eremiobacteraeota bacterium]